MGLTTVGTSPHLYRATFLKEAGLPGEVFTISTATILAALPPGPLRRLFETTYADSAAVRAALRDSPNVDLRIIALNSSTTGPTTTVSVDGSNLAQINGSLVGTQNVAEILLTLEFRHSLIR